MTASAPELIGILVACGAAAAALVLEDRRWQRAAMALALLTAPVLVVGSVWDETRVVDFRHSPAQVGAAVVVGGAALAALAAAVPPPAGVVRDRGVRRPAAAHPGRDRRRDREPARPAVPGDRIEPDRPVPRPVASGERRATSDGSPWPTRLRWLLAATVALYAIQSSYSADVANAIENTRLLPRPVRRPVRAPARGRVDAGPCASVVIAVGVVALGCALIGIYQYFTRDLFLNPELFDANELHVYFRVNSIFFDPNVFGRYLALAITALGACMAWGSSRRDLTAAGIVCAVALVGAGVQLLDHQLRRPARRARDRRRSCAGAGAGSSPTEPSGSPGSRHSSCAGGTPTSDVEDVRSIDAGHADLIKGGLALFGVTTTPTRATRATSASRSGLRLGLVRAGVLRPHRAGANDGLALGAGHGRRRAGGDRPRRLHSPAGLRPRDPAGLRARPLADANRRRRVLRRDPRRQLRLHGVRDRPGDLGAARAGDRRPRRSARGVRDDSAARCSNTSAAWRPRAPRTRPRASSRS